MCSLSENTLHVVVQACAVDSLAEKAQISHLSSVYSATELLHQTSLGFSLHKVRLIMQTHFCQTQAAKNEHRYENIRYCHFTTREATP